MGTNWFNELTFFVDENKRKVQFGFYTIALAGLGYAFRSVRALKKFRNVHEIPQTFIDRRIKLNGDVINIDSESAVLWVDHNPIFGSRFRRKSNPGLAVQICGVNVTNNGIIWLQHMLMNRCIYFTLLKRQQNQINCIVQFNRLNVAEELLKLGFATVEVIDFDIENDNIYIKYYQRLLTLEEKAEKKKLGIWADSQRSFKSNFKEKVLNVFYEWYYKLKK